MFKNPLLLIMAVTTLSTSAQSHFTKQTSTQIDALAERLISTNIATGLNVLLIKDGKTIYNKAFGYADAENKIAMRTDDIFRIASQTKLITSLAALMLFEKGAFLLDDPVSKYIPEFKDPQVLKDFNPADSSFTTVPALREVTLRDLLRHTSGIGYPFIGDARMAAVYAKHAIPISIGTTKGTLGSTIKKLGALPLQHQPGAAFTYGLNTDVLGYLIEVWSGTPLNVFFETQIFEPLGMQDTYFTLPEEKASRLAALYEHKNGKKVKVEGVIYDGNDQAYPTVATTYFSGGAGLSSTTADYAKILQLVVNRGTYGGRRFLGEKTIQLLLTNQLNESVDSSSQGVDFQFGFGVALITEKNKYLTPLNVSSFYWGGAFNTHYWADPKEGIIGLVYTQEYNPESYWNLGNLFKNVIYSALESNK